MNGFGRWRSRGEEATRAGDVGYYVPLGRCERTRKSAEWMALGPSFSTTGRRLRCFRRHPLRIARAAADCELDPQSNLHRDGSQDNWSMLASAGNLVKWGFRREFIFFGCIYCGD